MLDSALDKIAEKILSLDEASLAALLDKYKKKMEHFETSKEWEKSVIIFSIINAVRVKNQIFNEQILHLQNRDTGKRDLPKGKCTLRRVK